LRKAVESFQKGLPLPHTPKDPELPQDHIDTFAAHYPKGRDWRMVYPHLAKKQASANGNGSNAGDGTHEMCTATAANGENS
jgi:hypothetical protein